MAIENFDFVGSYNNQRFPNIDAERSINLFEYIDKKGKKPSCLISTSGLKDTGLVFGSTTGGFRAEFVLGGFEYYIIGSDIWRRDSNDIVTKLNSTPLPTSTGFARIDANNASTGPQIIFVDGQIGCIWDTGSNDFTYDIRTVDPAFPIAPLDVCFIDGFLLVVSGGSANLGLPNNTFQLSALNNAYSWGLVANTFTADSGTNLITVSTAYSDGMQVTVSTSGSLPGPLVANTTYYVIVVDATHIRLASTYANAVSAVPVPIVLVSDGTPTNTITNTTILLPGQLQQGSINSHPGPIVACRTLHRLILLFSTNYCEIWENAGSGTNLPIRRNNSLLMEYGTPSAGSVVASFDCLMFLAQDRGGLGAVMQVRGSEAIPVSNRALDFQLAQYASLNQVSDAKGILIKENGIIFYRLNFTTANHTFIYNISMSDPSTEEGRLWHEEQVLDGDRHPAQTHGYFNGNNYYGDYAQPILYKVSPSYTTNNGQIIPRIRIGRAYVPSTYNRVRADRWMADIIQGLTDVTTTDNFFNLLTETEIPITTESGINILLDPAGKVTTFNPDPHVVYLSISKDGGVTYGYRQEATIGGTGNRTSRTVWRKLGVIPRGQAFVPKLEFFGNISLIILGAAWAYEIMPE